MSKNNTLINPLIKARIEKYINTNEVYEKGCVISVYDGIAVISGADDVMLNELVQFENGTYGVVFNLNIDSVSVVLLGEYSNINEGSVIKRTKKIINALVGDELLGRVIDPLCNPIDGKGNINTKKTSPIEQNAHSIFERAKIDTPLETGIFLIDTIFPIGLGQRELIIGDSQTGKTTIAINTIINQRGKNINCIYVSIGQKKSSLARIINKLSENNALEYTTIVSASASDLPSLKYIAPFVGITIAEEWMHAGKNVLIIYDDLSKHASSYRTISLLLKRSPGREAFPGDIFYLHSRLLERSCKLNEEKKGGSITCLPIIETQAGEISAYIPTNLISITDGQLFTQRSLFNEGQKPAIDVSLSVSRIGSAAQIKSIKKTASNIKIDIAQFLDVVAFNKFDDDIDEHTLKIIEHGKRIMILLKQNNDTYYSQIEEIIMLFAIKSKLIDFIPLNNILDFNEKLLNEFINNETIIKINKKKDISNEDENILFNDLRLYIKKYVSDIPGYDISNYFEESDKE